jgi:hypothetical protein
MVANNSTMNTNKVLYKYAGGFSPIIQYLIVFTIFAGIIFILITIIPALQYYFMAVILFAIFIIFYVHIHGYWSDANNYYLEHIEKEINYKKGHEYAGIIIANKNLRFYKYFYIYNTGIILLVEHLKNRGMPIKILNNADEEHFKDFVYDKSCTELYIIGHGRRNALRIHKNIFVEYEDFKDAPRKKRVEQFHCCHKGGRSLAEVLGAEEKFKSNKKRYCEETINYLLNELIFDEHILKI